MMIVFICMEWFIVAIATAAVGKLVAAIGFTGMEWVTITVIFTGIEGFAAMRVFTCMEWFTVRTVFTGMEWFVVTLGLTGVDEFAATIMYIGPGGLSVTIVVTGVEIARCCDRACRFDTLQLYGMGSFVLRAVTIVFTSVRWIAVMVLLTCMIRFAAWALTTTTVGLAVMMVFASWEWLVVTICFICMVALFAARVIACVERLHIHGRIHLYGIARHYDRVHRYGKESQSPSFSFVRKDSIL